MPAGEQYEPALGVALALDPRPRQRDDMEIIALRGAVGYRDHHSNPSIWPRFAPGPFFVVANWCYGRSSARAALPEARSQASARSSNCLSAHERGIILGWGRLQFSDSANSRPSSRT